MTSAQKIQILPIKCVIVYNFARMFYYTCITVFGKKNCFVNVTRRVRLFLDGCTCFNLHFSPFCLSTLRSLNFATARYCHNKLFTMLTPIFYSYYSHWLFCFVVKVVFYLKILLLMFNNFFYTCWHSSWCSYINSIIYCLYTWW